MVISYMERHHIMAALCGIVVPHDDARATRMINKVDEKRLVSLVLGQTTEEAVNVQKTLLLRPSSLLAAGIYLYHLPTINRRPNRRTTRLSFALGLFNYRFYHTTVLVVPSGDVRVVSQILEGSMDLRPDIQQHFGNDASRMIPEWLVTACKENYLDRAVLKRLARVMSPNSDHDADDDSNGDNTSDKKEGDTNEDDVTRIRREFVTREPLCLHCRQPASTLCDGCHGVYFCASSRTCRQDAWSHDCVCATWKLYVERRDRLAAFSFDGWHEPLTNRACQVSEQPYRDFLKALGVRLNGDCSWWCTEYGGWAGGSGAGARRVDWTKRLSYAQGFAPLLESEIPAQETLSSFKRDELGLFHLSDWQEYYEIRGLPKSSPVALLMTFPLTLHYMITKYGRVPCTVAKMLQRPLHVHVVGAEKELQMLDLFQEVVLLSNIDLRLTFVVRADMIPEKMRGQSTNELSITIEDKLHVSVVAGSYGKNIDPMFDLKPPDMVVAFNAGLFAYESWRYPIEFLHAHPNVVGVFSDYNEWSGVQCAALAGSARSLCVNPFRQPLALPVYSMNLPQFSNGFLYAFNEQAID